MGRRLKRKRVLIPAGLGLGLMIVLGALWAQRKHIADDIIADQLQAYRLPAHYTIDTIEPGKQVITDLVLGDPQQPDFTASRVELRLHYRLGLPRIGSVTLVNPRLYGTQRKGRISFGSLDRVIYRTTGKSPALPDIDLVVRDGRGLINTSYGPLGFDFMGSGKLSGGFVGYIGAVAPGLAFGDCEVRNASLFGRLRIEGGVPRFNGPARMGSLACAKANLSVQKVNTQIAGASDTAFSTITGTASITTGAAAYARYSANGSDATLRGAWRNGVLELKHSLALRGVITPYASAALATLDGSAQVSNGLSRIDLRSELEGNGLRPGSAFHRVVDNFSRTTSGTLLTPLINRFARALEGQARGSAFVADISLRRSKEQTMLIIPAAQLRGRSGARLVSLSRVQTLFMPGKSPGFVGNIATGGPGLPQINGRMERISSQSSIFRMQMAPYANGGSALAIPELTIARQKDGRLQFSGQVIASGRLPGGSARNLAVPLQGVYGNSGGFSLWPQCIQIGFDRLTLANLSFEKRGLSLCPRAGHAIVEKGPGGLNIAAGTPGLDLAGTLGKTPIRLTSGAAGFAYPGTLAARDIAVSLGPPETASHFSLSHLEAQMGKDLVGRFDGAEVKLQAVPFDLAGAQGNWRFAQGRLELADTRFQLSDRRKPARFEPLIAKNASLSLNGNILQGEAVLRDPATGREVTQLAVHHDLANSVGRAKLTVAGLVFDDKLQPDQITPLAKGLVANVKGVVTGTGLIAWQGEKITSSGAFSSKNLDFAAAFGPVKGARGTIHFTDLIGLTTAPDQVLHMVSVNPGVEVTDGEIRFSLTGGKLLSVTGGRWPFLGGTLTLRRVDLDFGAREERRYIFDIAGLDAGAFVQRMNLGNISATGTFDGTVPIVFDASGNGRVEGGALFSRPPGGNVAYVGKLTYKDLSPIANFAFDALRSLDYDHMEVLMNGPLTGEIVTQVRFQGVHQGEGAKSNFITRQLARLPLEFRVNVRAPFYQLLTSLNSLRDPAAIRDPRSLGLIADDGTRLYEKTVHSEDAKRGGGAEILRRETPIQQQESEKRP